MAKRPSSVIGIDVGSSAIKIVEIKQSGKKLIIDNAISFPSVSIWKDGLPVDSDVASITLQKALAAFGGGSKLGTMAIPTAASMVKIIPMDSSLKGDDLWATIEANIPQFFPFSAEEVFLDFKVNGPSMGIEGHSDVLVVATQKEFVNARELCAEVAGIKLDAVDIDVYALLNIIQMIEPIDSYADYDGMAIIDVGLYRTGLCVVSGSGSVYVREIPIGGERLTELISQNSNISLEEAESKKMRGAWGTDQSLNDALNTFVDEIGQQIISAIDIYIPNNPQVTIQKIIIAGGIMDIPDIKALLEKVMEREISVLNLTKLFEVSDRVTPKLNGSSLASLSVACGLAMRDYV